MTAVPLLGDISLQYVQQIEHTLEGGFVSTPIAGLPGDLQQRTGRPSHRIQISGVLFGAKAAEELGKLQDAAAAGKELTFASDITTALDLQRVVITHFRAIEVAGQPGRYRYGVALAESPPLPPPAQVEPFGGLGDFGIGDLGFDTDLLGELGDLAGEVAGAVTAAMDAIDTLSALASLGDIGGLGNFMQPFEPVVRNVSDIASGFKNATRAVSELFGT
ncbi:MAG TPA: hypothetical protein VJB57_15640 [Dehalococcoidia bacterium]|nr:hypothetical protein [Dehalococcoidia bacterium]